MKTKNIALALCVAVLSNFCVAAETIPGPVKVRPEIRDLGEWDAVKAENAFLDDQIKNQELKNKLRGLSGDGGLALPSNGSTAGSGARQIVVQMVSGLQGNLRALLCISGSASQTVKVGSRVNGGGVIRSISISEVTIELNKNIVSIPFASDNVCSGTAAPEIRAMPGLPIGMPASPMAGGAR